MFHKKLTCGVRLECRCSEGRIAVAFPRFLIDNLQETVPRSVSWGRGLPSCPIDTAGLGVILLLSSPLSVGMKLRPVKICLRQV
jgi:hypothetical protein